MQNVCNIKSVTRAENVCVCVCVVSARANLPKVFATFGALEIELLRQRLHVLFEMRMLERVPQLLVAVDSERIEVHTNRARENDRILQQNSEYDAMMQNKQNGNGLLCLLT